MVSTRWASHGSVWFASVIPAPRPPLSIRRFLRWSLIAGYVGFCSLLGLLALAAIHAALPHKAEWSLEEAPASYIAAPDTNDHWQWTPKPGWELLALARADASLGRRFIPGFGTPNRRVRVYFQLRAPEMSERIAAAAREDPSRLVSRTGSKRTVLGPDGVPIHIITTGWDDKDDGPRPAWWNPTHRITIDQDGRIETFFVNPEELEKICYLRDNDFTVYSP
jgi:hypothetical protein